MKSFKNKGGFSDEIRLFFMALLNMFDCNFTKKTFLE